MKFKKFGSNKIVNKDITKYIIKGPKLKNGSGPEQKVWAFLYPYWKNYVVLEQFSPPSCRLRLDLFNVSLGICIEISPASSHSYNKFFHKNAVGFSNNVKRDLEKQDWIEDNGFKYVELVDEDIDNLSKKLFEEKFKIYL